MAIAEKTTARIADDGTITKLDLSGFILFESVYTACHSDPHSRIGQVVILLVLSGEFHLRHRGQHLVCRRGEGFFINAGGQAFSAGAVLFACYVRSDWFRKHEIETANIPSRQFAATGPLHDLACALYLVYRINHEQAALAACGNLLLFFAHLLTAAKKPQAPE